MSKRTRLKDFLTFTGKLFQFLASGWIFVSSVCLIVFLSDLFLIFDKDSKIVFISFQRNLSSLNPTFFNFSLKNLLIPFFPSISKILFTVMSFSSFNFSITSSYFPEFHNEIKSSLFCVNFFIFKFFSTKLGFFFLII